MNHVQYDRHVLSLDLGDDRMVHSNIKASISTNETPQTDSAGFTGKKYRTQDIKYGHLLGEFDTLQEAKNAAIARPYTRVLRYPEPSQMQQARNSTRKKATKFNPDKEF